MRIQFFILATLLMLSSCELIPDFMKNKKADPLPDLGGTWNLIIYRGEDSNGRYYYPFDKNTPGIAIFDKNKNFSIQFFDPDRPLLSKADPFYCSDPEIRIAFLSCRSFYGLYEISDTAVHMNITGSSLPNETGMEQEYAYRLKGDSLLLISPSIRLNGQEIKEHTIWIRERVEPVAKNRIRSILSRFEHS